MKEILFKDFVLTPQGNGVRFDLSKKVLRTKKESVETYEGTDIIGYDLPFEGCLKRIIQIETAKGEETMYIEQYLKEYEKISKELTDYLREIKK